MSEFNASTHAADTARHQMTVLLDSGLYRHVVMANPECSNQWFELVTWPGYLAYTGDMGSYLFRRNDDMFSWFRHSGEPDFHYWASKVEAECRDGTLVYDAATFRQSIEYQLTGEVDGEILACLLDEIDTDENYSIYTYQAFCEAHDIDCCELPTYRTISYRFAWACRAIQLAVQRYDEYTKLKGLT